MESAGVLKEEGNKLFKECRYEEACDKYTKALELDSTNAVIFSNRSVTYAKLGDYERALSDALQCIELNPQWPKGFLRKTSALELLERHDDVMKSACEGFRLSGEGPVKRELVARWLKANQKLNCLPEGSIELPRGILILSKDYLQVLAYLMQSLSGERPLSLELTEQLLYSCAEQMEKLLSEFSECVNPVIKEWASCLPCEIFPHSINPVAKPELEKRVQSRNESFIRYLENDIDPALYPLLRPLLGLVVLVVLNRSNILTESNTGHHSAELMNRALLPLFQSSILCTHDYLSMYVGRLCAVLDSFIGRGYKLSSGEIKTVQDCCSQLKKVMHTYPTDLPEYQKDKPLSERILSNVQNNILLPPRSLPPKIPSSSAMSVELAEQVVKERPQEVKVYLEKHLRDFESVKILTMGEVEELLTMTGIFIELKMKEEALYVFRKGERAFFQVLGHMLSCNTLMLDQCPATIAPIRQLVLSEASLLNEHGLFAGVVLRWKCLFRDFRSELIRQNSGDVFRAFFQLYLKHKITSETETSETEMQAAILQQMKDEEKLLQESAKSTLDGMASSTYDDLSKLLGGGVVTLDYIFFAPLRENPLLDAYCVIFEAGKDPIVCELNYKAIHDQSALVAKLLASQSAIDRAKVYSELSILAKSIFPQELLDMMASGTIKHLYICPDSDLAHIPFDSLPVSIDTSGTKVSLFERFSVSILSSVRQLFSVPNSSEPNKTCSIIGNPNFDLCKPATKSSLQKLIGYFGGYFNISVPSGPTLEHLSCSQDEIDFITSHLQSSGLAVQSLVGDKATLSHVVSLDNPLLVHISSHAYSSSSGRSVVAFRGNFYDDLKSASIALAGFNTFSREDFDNLHPECGTGQLPPLAIYSMKLQGTKLVFLSACSSAAGTTPIQEAADSLAEAFLVAGAETVIAALWPVGDESATEISKLFYERLTVPGVRPSEALSYAKTRLREGERYWSCCAAFVCRGLDKPLFM